MWQLKSAGEGQGLWLALAEFESRHDRRMWRLKPRVDDYAIMAG